jgi:L-alanine-DL-glutamate epimerase-like enolase superfamily enzyme
LLNRDGTNLDPFRAWDVMMAGEKPGGHGERCVAVGALDMAIWDAAAKIADVPLYRFICESLQRTPPPQRIAVYASGGYPYQRGQKLEKRRALMKDWAQFLAGSDVVSLREAV